jgi:outer membrane protein TolC
VSLRLLATIPFLAACAVPDAAPLDATDPAPLVGRATGVAASVEFRVEGEPDDAPAAPARLTLADALREALAHDPRLQQALARWHRARAVSDEVRVLANPLLSIGVGFAESLSDSKVTVGITQEIATWLQRPHKAGAADARVRAAAEEAFVVAFDAVSETRAAYLAAQAAEARRPLVQTRLELLTKQRDLHAQALAEGEGLKSDVTALDAERASIDVELADLEAERIAARIELARLIGRPSDPGAWTLDPWPALPAGASAARPWIDGALRRRAEVRAIGWELAALGEERALIETWPWEGAAAGLEAEYDEGLTVGPVAEIPLWLFDPSAPRTAAIDAADAEMRHRAVEVRRAVIRDVRRALADEAAARRALDLLDRGLIPLLESRRAELDAARRLGEAEITILVLADR